MKLNILLWCAGKYRAMTWCACICDIIRDFVAPLNFQAEIYENYRPLNYRPSPKRSIYKGWNITGFRRNVNEAFALMGCYVVLVGKWEPKFR